jgi:hypothetical protein
VSASSSFRRDRALVVLGRVVLRYTWGEVMHHPEEVVRDLQAAPY